MTERVEIFKIEAIFFISHIFLNEQKMMTLLLKVFMCRVERQLLLKLNDLLVKNIPFYWMLSDFT